MMQRPPRSTLFSLHDALPILVRPRRRPTWSSKRSLLASASPAASARATVRCNAGASARRRSEEHTSELQSRRDLVCRLLLEKKKKKNKLHYITSTQHLH